MEDLQGPITALLKSHSSSAPHELDDLFRVVYPELRRRARLLMGRERSGHTLQPTALVHETFLRLFNGEPLEWQDSTHFFATAACAMRRVLADYARRTLAAKRQAPSSSPAPDSPALPLEQILDLDRALTSMRLHAPRAAQVVELKYFAGLTNDEAAAALHIAPKTVAREWAWARAALRSALGRAPLPPPRD